MKLIRWIVHLLAILPFLFVAQPSAAIDLNAKAIIKNEFDLNAQVGIDKATRDYIDTLPVELRTQIVEAVRESLGMLDKSVKEYIDQVDVMLANQILNAQCAADGVIGNGIGQVVQAIPIFGKKAVPIEDLVKDINQTIASYGFRDPPTKYYNVYLDLLTRIKTTSCNVRSVPVAGSAVAKMYDEVFKRWSVWNHLHQAGCSDASNCFSKMKSDLTLKLPTCDTRDIKAVDASNRLAAVIAPADPGFFGKWIPTAAEVSLAELIAIDNELEATKAIRLLKAATVIDDVQAKTSATQAAANSALLQLGQVGTDAPLDKYQTIWQAVDPILAMQAAVPEEISLAIELRPDMKNQYDSVKSAYEAALKAAQQQRNVAQARFDAIKSRPVPTQTTNPPVVSPIHGKP